MTKPIQRVIIAGGGTAGWMSAIALRAALPKAVEILLIESEDIGTIGVGEATLPTMRLFNDRVGIDEKAFIQATEATFKLGIEFVDFACEGNRYFHVFGDFGAPYEGLAAHQIWRKLTAAGDTYPLEAYSLATQMAEAGKFFPPNPDPRSPMHDYSYAFQFDASLYAKYLRTLAESRGVKRRNARITGVNLDSQNGHISSLTLDDGGVEAADFFIDCSGFRALLIGGALKVGYTDWSHYLPVDRAWAVPTGNPDGGLTPYVTCTAREAGWQWRIPLQHRTGNGHVFSSRFMDEDRARDILLANLETPPLKDPMLLRFTTGYRNRFWEKNCVCVGLSSGFLEPLESTSINFIQSGILRLLELFPSSAPDPFLITEYNRRTLEAYERTRDFIIAHYHLNRREGGELWKYCAGMEIPEALSYKLELYRRRGEVVLEKYDQFLEPSWISILNGQEIIAEAYDPLADRVPLDTLRELMRQRREGIRRVVAQLPPHAEFIARHCPSAGFMQVQS